MCGILLLLHGVDVAPHNPPQVTVCWTLTLLCLALAVHNSSMLPQASPTPSRQTVSRTGYLHTLKRRGPDSLSTEQVRTCSVTLLAGKPTTPPAYTFKLLILCCLQVSLGANASLELQGSLLQLRGTMPGVSPVKDMHGNVLVLNGKSQCSAYCQHQSETVS